MISLWIFDALFAIKIMVVSGALLLASIQDVRSREVSDKIWGISIPLGLVLTIIEAFMTPGYPYMLALLSGIFSCALAFGIYYAGLYGGADAKALAMIAAAFPLPHYGFIGASPFFPLTVLGNGIILSLLLIPACLLWNFLFYLRGGALFSGIAARWWEKLVAVLIGIRVKVSTAESVHFNPMEKTRKDGTIGFRFIHKVDDLAEGAAVGEKDVEGNSAERSSNLLGEENKGREATMREGYVWVTPAIPMIVFLFAGFVLYFLAGDFVFRIVLAFW
ncbi:MAG: prepilin peptidase [Candidatus Methanomethyliaceae archaeon]|nr:prepilin peptidase [Candidatus Methanomethyliaceae archaeon]